jgi:large subunit ribosomal protein L3
MIGGLIGKKIGMSQLFTPEGKIVAVTLIQAGPCIITQVKTNEKDGYEATQVGLIEKVSPKRLNKPMKGHLAKANSPNVRKLVEFPIIDKNKIKVGEKVTAADVFKESEIIDVAGVTKGKGFQGVVKRHRFRGGADTHGSKSHRAPGSIGASSFPSRVFKGHRMGGRMGGDNLTIRNLKILKLDAENNVIAVKGCVPGYNGSYLILYKHL